MRTIPENNNPPLRLYMHMQQAFGLQQVDWLIQAPGRDMWLAAVITDDTLYHVTSGDADSGTKFDRRSAKLKQTVLKRPLPIWARYPAGVITTLADNGIDVGGFQAVFVGDEPAGPRYDFGVGLVFAMFCYEITGTPYTNESLLDVVEQVRRQFI